jgi:DNA-directed RNA polymerase subunit RPC12/RpoP
MNTMPTERARKRALLASGTTTGVRGVHDEVAILCADCRRPMLILSKDRPPLRHVRCLDCGNKRFVPGYPNGDK